MSVVTPSRGEVRGRLRRFDPRVDHDTPSRFRASSPCACARTACRAYSDRSSGIDLAAGVPVGVDGPDGAYHVTSPDVSSAAATRRARHSSTRVNRLRRWLAATVLLLGMAGPKPTAGLQSPGALAVRRGLPETVDRGGVTSGFDRGPRETGTLTGRVRFSGAVPEAFFVAESNTPQHILEVDPETQGLRHAVVFVEGTPATPPSPTGGDTVVVNQKNWIFRPPVLAVRAGQAVRFTNEDSANHSVRSTDRLPANRFGAYTGNGEDYTHRFATPPDTRPIEIFCDIHAWMAAWIYVFDHAGFAVTDRQGWFRIDDVPAGAHRLVVQQPAGGLARTIDVGVEPGGTTPIEIGFETTDLRLPR